MKELGFDPGAADGKSGPRTVAAIRAYQRSIDEAPDGKLTEILYQRLTGQPEPPPPAVAEPAPPAETASEEATSACLLSNGIWQFEDGRGSSFSLAFRQDGSVEGPIYPRHWRWQSADQKIEIVYDNGMGLVVTRNGHLQHQDRMVGEAKDSRGRSWSWSAQRSPLSDGNGECQPGGTP